jgi:hypothetical protein
LYSAHGVNDFVICCGYKGYVIKEYFANYFLHMSDVTFDMSTNAMEVHQRNAEPWRVTLVDTGDHTLTGGRLKRVAPYVQDEEAFCRGGRAKLNTPISGRAAPMGEDRARVFRSTEDEQTTTPEPLSGIQGQGGHRGFGR